MSGIFASDSAFALSGILFLFTYLLFTYILLFLTSIYQVYGKYASGLSVVKV